MPTLLALALLALPAGCRTQDERTIGRPMEGENVPTSLQRARRLEEEGLEALRHAGDTTDQVRRREHYDTALQYFRDARAALEDELVRDPGTPERQRTLQGEIDRLSDMIARTHRERPIG